MAELFLWKIERRGGLGYDEYVAAVVVALTADDARLIHPNGKGTPPAEWNAEFSQWPVKPKQLKVTKIGTAAPKLKAGDVVLSDFQNG